MVTIRQTLPRRQIPQPCAYLAFRRVHAPLSYTPTPPGPVSARCSATQVGPHPGTHPHPQPTHSESPGHDAAARAHKTYTDLYAARCSVDVPVDVFALMAAGQPSTAAAALAALVDRQEGDEEHGIGEGQAAEGDMRTGEDAGGEVGWAAGEAPQAAAAAGAAGELQGSEESLDEILRLGRRPSEDVDAMIAGLDAAVAAAAAGRASGHGDGEAALAFGTCSSPFADAAGSAAAEAAVDDTLDDEGERTSAVRRLASACDSSFPLPSYLLATPPPASGAASDGMAFTPPPGTDYPASIAPTPSDASSLPRTADYDAYRMASAYGSRGESVSGGGAAGGRRPTLESMDEHEFMAAREERSKKIASQLAALQQESRQLQEASAQLRERTKEIGRSVGLPTPPLMSSPRRPSQRQLQLPPGGAAPPAAGQLAAASRATSGAVPEVAGAAAQGLRAPSVSPRVSSGGIPIYPAPAGSPPPPAPASNRSKLPPPPHAAPAPSAAPAVAGPHAPLVANHAPPASSTTLSIPGPGLTPDDGILPTSSVASSTSPIHALPAASSSSSTTGPSAAPHTKGTPISWALPNRLLPPASSQSPQRVFPSPPKGAVRRLDRAGSCSSSVMDPPLPRWSDQLDSPGGSPGWGMGSFSDHNPTPPQHHHHQVPQQPQQQQQNRAQVKAGGPAAARSGAQGAPGAAAGAKSRLGPQPEPRPQAHLVAPPPLLLPPGQGPPGGLSPNGGQLSPAGMAHQLQQQQQHLAGLLPGQQHVPPQQQQLLPAPWGPGPQGGRGGVYGRGPAGAAGAVQGTGAAGKAKSARGAGGGARGVQQQQQQQQPWEQQQQLVVVSPTGAVVCVVDWCWSSCCSGAMCILFASGR